MSLMDPEHGIMIKPYLNSPFFKCAGEINHEAFSRVVKYENKHPRVAYKMLQRLLKRIHKETDNDEIFIYPFVSIYDGPNGTLQGLEIRCSGRSWILCGLGYVESCPDFP